MNAAGGGSSARSVPALPLSVHSRQPVFVRNALPLLPASHCREVESSLAVRFTRWSVALAAQQRRFLNEGT